MTKIFIVGLGGFLGAAARYLTRELVGRLIFSPFPYGTFIANMVGCLIFGFLAAFVEYRQILSPQWRLFLMVGFLGGLTTFSSYSYDSFSLMQNNHLILLSLNILLHTIVGIITIWGGYRLGMVALT